MNTIITEYRIGRTYYAVKSIFKLCPVFKAIEYEEQKKIYMCTLITLIEIKKRKNECYEYLFHDVSLFHNTDKARLVAVNIHITFRKDAESDGTLISGTNIFCLKNENNKDNT